MLKYTPILVLSLLFAGCMNHAKYTVAEATLEVEKGDLIDNLQEHEYSIDSVDKDKLTTKWTHMYVGRTWEYTYRFVADFNSKTTTVQCYVRNMKKAWHFKKCKHDNILKLVKFDLAEVSG